MFTTLTGGLVLRQTVSKSLQAAAAKAEIDPTHLGTHTGRRSVVTALYTEAEKSLGERPDGADRVLLCGGGGVREERSIRGDSYRMRAHQARARKLTTGGEA